MAAVKWDELLTIQDWSTALGTILDEARVAIEQNNSNKRLELQDLLVEYVKKSPVKCNALDDIASKAVHDLFLSQIEASLQAIASRNAELKKATDLIVGVTEQVKKDRKAIMFENTLESLNKVSSSINTIKALEKQLENPDQNLLNKIIAVDDAIKELEGVLK